MPRRPDVLEYTVLGVLSDGPLHGYELRKRLTAILGPFRALSYGSLYPCLHRLTERGWVVAADVPTSPAVTRRAKVDYSLTPDGKDAFAAWVADTGPGFWDDEAFAARLAFFSRTEARVRLQLLEGRRARLQERLRSLETAIDRAQDRVDVYEWQLQQHGIDGANREVGWISQLIEAERNARATKKAVRKAIKSANSDRKRKT